MTTAVGPAGLVGFPMIYRTGFVLWFQLCIAVLHSQSNTIEAVSCTAVGRSRGGNRGHRGLSSYVQHELYRVNRVQAGQHLILPPRVDSRLMVVPGGPLFRA